MELDGTVQEVTEEFREVVGGEDERKFRDEDLYAMAELVIEFAQKMSDIGLYDYQREAALGLVYSILAETAEELTMLFARQSGKTEMLAVVIPGLMVLLPILGNAYKHEPRLSKFRRGFWVGLFAPTGDLSYIMYSRIIAKLYGEVAREILEDPEIDLQLPHRSQKAQLSNGSRVDCNTAAPGAKIEGKTYHLIVCEECQDIDDYKVRKSIHPMGASTAATIVKIGTPVPWTCDFQQACSRNKRKDLDGKAPFAHVRMHYEFDYKIAMRVNERYVKYIAREKERLGEESDDFRMSYMLHWLTERGKFLNEGKFEECAIYERQVMEAVKLDRAVVGGKKKLEFVRPSYPTTNDRSSFAQVAAIDFGKSDSSTVVTVARVWWDNPVVLYTAEGDEIERYFVHVQNWLELYGDDYGQQIPQIVEFLANYSLGLIVCDSTGPGDPLTSWLATQIDEWDVEIEPFVFSSSSKDVGYRILLQEIEAKRFTYPAGSRASKTKKFSKFRQQMLDLEKRYRGARLVVEKPNERDAHDDYPDSAMMILWGVDSYADLCRDVETSPNSILGRHVRHDLSMLALRRSRVFGRVAMRDRNLSNVEYSRMLRREEMLRSFDTRSSSEE